jgi:hypothetical protein
MLFIEGAGELSLQPPGEQLCQGTRRFIGPGKDQPLEGRCFLEIAQIVGNSLEVLVYVTLTVSLVAKGGPAALALTTGHVFFSSSFRLDLVKHGCQQSRLLLAYVHDSDARVVIQREVNGQQIRLAGKAGL